MISIAQLDQFAAYPFAPDYPTDRRTLFSPDDQVHAALIWLLGQAQTSIDLAMYAFTDPALCVALVQATGRGVKVRLTLDSSQFKDDGEQSKLAALLNAAGVDYTVGTSEKGAIMHLKSGVIDDAIIFTGSTNWSASGEELQDNSLTIVTSHAEATQFIQRFAVIHAYQSQHGGTQ
jgi:phosphatidylserine/phosphatidylglycerophosphate/cardiolipin synthase-like enzyme